MHQHRHGDGHAAGPNDPRRAIAITTSARVPSIAIVKLTNGTDNDAGIGPLVAVGSTADMDLQRHEDTGNVTLTGVA